MDHLRRYDRLPDFRSIPMTGRMSTRAAFALPTEASHDAGPQKLSYGQQNQIIGQQSQEPILILRYTAASLARRTRDDRERPQCLLIWIISLRRCPLTARSQFLLMVPVSTQPP